MPGLETSANSNALDNSLISASDAGGWSGWSASIFFLDLVSAGRITFLSTRDLSLSPAALGSLPAFIPDGLPCNKEKKEGGEKEEEEEEEDKNEEEDKEEEEEEIAGGGRRRSHGEDKIKIS